MIAVPHPTETSNNRRLGRHHDPRCSASLLHGCSRIRGLLHLDRNLGILLAILQTSAQYHDYPRSTLPYHPHTYLRTSRRLQTPTPMATRTITDQFPLPAATAIREIRELVGDGPRLAVDHSGALTHPRVAVHVAAAELGRALVLDVAVVGVHAFAGEGGSEERREGEEKATEVKGLHCGWVAYRFVGLCVEWRTWSAEV
jgi:hypothetical protein